MHADQRPADRSGGHHDAVGRAPADGRAGRPRRPVRGRGLRGQHARSLGPRGQQQPVPVRAARGGPRVRQPPGHLLRRQRHVRPGRRVRDRRARARRGHARAHAVRRVGASAHRGPRHRRRDGRPVRVRSRRRGRVGVAGRGQRGPGRPAQAQARRPRTGGLDRARPRAHVFHRQVQETDGRVTSPRVGPKKTRRTQPPSTHRDGIYPLRVSSVLESATLYVTKRRVSKLRFEINAVIYREK